MNRRCLIEQLAMIALIQPVLLQVNSNLILAFIWLIQSYGWIYKETIQNILKRVWKQLGSPLN